MKKLLSLLAIILAGGSFMLHAAVKGIPKTFHGNWIDTTTNLWTLSLWDGFAAADASLWDYEKWSGNGKTARATLRRADGTQRKFRFELRNDSTLVMTGADGRHVLLRESLTTAQRPFTASGRDTSSFRSMPWVNDSIRVEGFITGYKPGDAVYHYWSAELFGFGAPNTPMNTDSLGRFRATIPATHDQLHTIGTDVAAGPGNRIFIAYSSEGERHLFMGDNARVNQELDGHRAFQVVRQYLPNVNFRERISDPMSWRFARISACDMALAGIADYCREHRMSRKTQQFCNAIAKNNTIAMISMLPDKHPELGYPFAYFMPGEGLDYSDPELLLYPRNSTLINPFLALWRMYAPLYVADVAGFRGRDRETFLETPRIRYTDPKRFKEFYDREQLRIVSIFNSITPDIRLQWAAPVADSMVPQGGLNRDIAFAEGLALVWSFTEEPISGQTLSLIDSTLRDSPFLRDTLRGLNERYRILARKNAALDIPMGTVDSTLTQPDSILSIILRPYAGKVVYMAYIEPGVPTTDKELDRLPAILDSLADKDVEFIFVAADINPQTWRNTIAKHGFTGPNTIHYRLPLWQVNPLAQRYLSGGAEQGFFLLFDRTGEMAASPAPNPSEGDKLLERIDELLAR